MVYKSLVHYGDARLGSGSLKERSRAPTLGRNEVKDPSEAVETFPRPFLAEMPDARLWVFATAVFGRADATLSAC